MERLVAITGAGAVTAIGGSVPAFWEALLAGRSGIGPVSLFDASPYQARTAAEVGSVPEDARGEIEERAHRLALAAASEALATCDDFGGIRSGVVVGTTLGGNRSWTEWLAKARTGGDATHASTLSRSTLASATRLLAERTDARGPAVTLSVACASGTAAIGLGADLIRRKEADRVLAGGYDALSEFVFSGFDALHALTRSFVRPFDRARDGLALGEGAGFVLLEDAEQARRRGADVLALVRGYASACDAHHMTRPSPEGAGLARAIDGALHDARVSGSMIGFVSSHGTATPFNDRMEAAALSGIFGEEARGIPLNSIKAAVGHTLGAAGALEAIMTALVLRHGVIPPTLNHNERDDACDLNVVAGGAVPTRRPISLALSTSSAFGGTNAALVLERA